MTIEGVSRDEADKFMAANGGRWCCTSCGSASWL
jgi:ribosomal protein S27AE